MPDIKLGSLFDGIGVFPLAASRCGIRPVWASEIEKAPISITKRHFPDMVHLGDPFCFAQEVKNLLNFGFSISAFLRKGKRKPQFRDNRIDPCPNQFFVVCACRKPILLCIHRYKQIWQLLKKCFLTVDAAGSFNCTVKHFILPFMPANAFPPNWVL